MAHIYDDDPYDDNPAYCSTCGREVEPDARFCDNCGAVIDPQAAGSPQYTPGSLISTKASRAWNTWASGFAWGQQLLTRFC